MCSRTQNTQKCPQPVRGIQKQCRKQGQGDEGMKSEVVIPAPDASRDACDSIQYHGLERELAPSCLPQERGTEELGPEGGTAERQLEQMAPWLKTSRDPGFRAQEQRV